MVFHNQHCKNKFEFFISTNGEGLKEPKAIVHCDFLKPLEIFFNSSSHRLDNHWFKQLAQKVIRLENSNHTISVSKEEFEVLKYFSSRNLNILDSSINSLIQNSYTIAIDESSFILELIKYFNEERLFTIFGSTDSIFHEIKIIEEDQLSILVRKSKSLITKYFTKESPLIIETDELLSYFKNWFEFVYEWETNKTTELE